MKKIILLLVFLVWISSVSAIEIGLDLEKNELKQKEDLKFEVTYENNDNLDSIKLNYIVKKVRGEELVNIVEEEKILKRGVIQKKIGLERLEPGEYAIFVKVVGEALTQSEMFTVRGRNFLLIGLNLIILIISVLIVVFGLVFLIKTNDGLIRRRYKAKMKFMAWEILWKLKMHQKVVYVSIAIGVVGIILMLYFLGVFDFLIEKIYKFWGFTKNKKRWNKKEVVDLEL